MVGVWTQQLNHLSSYPHPATNLLCDLGLLLVFSLSICKMGMLDVRASLTDCYEN